MRNPCLFVTRLLERFHLHGFNDLLYRIHGALAGIVVWRMDGPLRWSAAVDLRCTARHDDARRPRMSEYERYKYDLKDYTFANIRVDVDPLDGRTGTFHIGRDCTVSIDDNPISWDEVSYALIRMDGVEPLKLELHASDRAPKVYIGRFDSPIAFGKFRVNIDQLRAESEGFNIGRDCKVEIDGLSTRWALLSGFTIRIERDKAVQIALDLVATPS